MRGTFIDADGVPRLIQSIVHVDAAHYYEAELFDGQRRFVNADVVHPRSQGRASEIYEALEAVIKRFW